MLSTQNLIQEFDRQTYNLVSKGYLNALGLSDSELKKTLEPLKQKVAELDTPEINLDQGTLPFVIVINGESLSSEQQMSLTQKGDNQGVTILRPHTSENFKTIKTVNIPQGIAYLLIDIDRGKENINLPPDEALKIINAKKRSPLTINEGIAIVTHFPEFLIKNNCFSLLASRTGTDQRVPAIWINAKKEPNLGWCWDGNPHTWLGSASCLTRLGV